MFREYTWDDLVMSDLLGFILCPRKSSILENSQGILEKRSISTMIGYRVQLLFIMWTLLIEPFTSSNFFFFLFWFTCLN